MTEQSEHEGYEIKIEGHTITSTDPQVSGRDVCGLAGVSPASDYTVIMLDGRGAQVLGLDEKLDLTCTDAIEIRLFHGDRAYRFLVDEREFVWGADSITVEDIRRYARIDDASGLYLASAGDKELDEEGEVRLKREGVERLRSGPRRQGKVTIRVNARPKEVERGRLSFNELIALAFGSGQGGDNVAYTVAYRKGPKTSPEGVLLADGSVKVREGMIFNVTNTTQS